MSAACPAPVALPKPAEVAPGQRWWLHDRAFEIADVKGGIAESADCWQIPVAEMLSASSGWRYLGEVPADPDLDAGIADDGRAAERRDVVAWLRREGDAHEVVASAASLAGASWAAARTLREAAAAIESGEHRRPR